MKPEEWGEFFEGVLEACEAAAPELVRRTSVALLGYARNYTPPNPGGAKDPGAAPVKKLRERIRANIVGGKNPPSAVPSNEKGGARPLDVRGEQGWGYFGFVVPRGLTRRRKIRYESPAVVLAKRRWKRRGDYTMATRSGPWEWHWVRKRELEAWVKERQDRAGSLLGGWLAAAEEVAMSSTGAFKRARGEKTAAGMARFVMGGGSCRFSAQVWPRYRSMVFERYVERFYVYLPRYAQGAIKNVKHWYLKSLGFGKTGYEQSKESSRRTRQRKAWDKEKVKNLRKKVR